MFAPSQHDVRRFFCETHSRQRQSLPLTPMQTLAALWIAEHPEYHAELADVRNTLAHRVRRPVTFGWGPRFLHSTGQFHKGGPAEGVYVQISADPVEDLAVPGKDYTFGRLIASQAAGDAQVLADHGRPVLRLHLTDVESGVAAVRSALA